MKESCVNMYSDSEGRHSAVRCQGFEQPGIAYDLGLAANAQRLALAGDQKNDTDSGRLEQSTKRVKTLVARPVGDDECVLVEYLDEPSV